MAYTASQILDLLNTSNRAVERAILFLYSEQTTDEQAGERTAHSNARGFSAFDAKFGCSLAKQIQKGRTLTPSQLQAARKMLRKYVGQLLREANRPKGGAGPIPNEGPKAPPPRNEAPKAPGVTLGERHIRIGHWGPFGLYADVLESVAVVTQGSQVTAVPVSLARFGSYPWFTVWSAAMGKVAKKVDRAGKVYRLAVDQRGKPEGDTAMGMFRDLRVKIEAEAAR